MAELVKPCYLTAAEPLVARHSRVDAVQLPKSDLLQPEPFAAFDRLLTQIFGATIGFPIDPDSVAACAYPTKAR